jgi:hypothetical protein
LIDATPWERRRMTSPITSTSDANVIVALNLATDALATARQLAMPRAAEAAGALILGAFEGGVSADIDAPLAVPIAYARGAAAWLVTEGIDGPWGPKLHRRCDRLATVLGTICAGLPRDPPPDGLHTPAQAARKPPTLASVAKQASKAGIEIARYETKPDGTIVAVVGKGEQQQGNEVDEWLQKHASKTQGH